MSIASMEAPATATAPKKLVPDGANYDPAAFFALINQPAGVREIRILKVKKRNGYAATASGYFTDAREAGRNAANADKNFRAPGVYLTLNRVSPDLLARSTNKIEMDARSTTQDADILHRDWLLLDIDPVRPAGISATDDEMMAAGTLGTKLRRELAAEGWPQPIRLMSGNGFYLIYRIDLPNDDESTDLIKRVLHGLATRFDTTVATVDTSTFNASRIAKLAGTTARKGDDFKGAEGIQPRPHRMAWFKLSDEELQPVTAEQLESVAAKPEEKKPAERINGTATNHAPTGSNVWERCWKYLSKCSDAVEGQNGSGVALEAACNCFRFGMSPTEARSMMDQWNRQKAKPPFSPAELEHKVTDGEKKVTAAGEFGKFIKGEFGKTSASSAPSSEPSSRAWLPQLIDSAAFDRAEYIQRFLIQKILVAGQPTVVGGKQKSMKTSTLVDLAVSLGTGTKFLGEFETTAHDVVLLSGESGEFTIRETARRVAAAKGVQLANARIRWGFDLPQLAKDEDMKSLADVISTYSAEVVIIDPAYLCLMDGAQGKQASNIFDMGPLLLRLSRLGAETKSTIIICHHCRKNDSAAKSRSRDMLPPELEDLSMAGFGEWARQWILLGRREAYVANSGLHQMWMNVGGSAGHSGLYAVDMDEGVLGEDFTGRKWDVRVSGAAEAIQDKKTSAAEKKASEKKKKEENCRCEVLGFLQGFPEGETKNAISEGAGINKNNLQATLDLLEKEGVLDICEIKKGNQHARAYRIRPVQQEF